MKGGKLHTIFTSLVDSTSGGEFIDLGEGDTFTLQQFHVEVWGEQDFEGHATVTMHNSNGCKVPLTWILLDIQSTVDLIENAKILVQIRTVRDENAIRVH